MRLILKEVFKKGGPYIGPRGGKWADPERTIPWYESKRLSKQKFKEEMNRRRDEGLIVTGPRTFKYKEIIKAAGGVWDSWEKQWLVPSLDVKHKLDSYMARGGSVVGTQEYSDKNKLDTEVGKEIVEQAKHEIKAQEAPSKKEIDTLVSAMQSIFHNAGGGKGALVDKLGLDLLDYSGNKLTKKGEDTISQLTRIEVSILTDACRELESRIPTDLIRREQIELKKELERKKAAVVKREKDLADGKYTIARGQGYGGVSYSVGQVIEDHEVGIVTVVSSGKKYFSQDGLSFGVGDDRGYIYYAHVRKANKEEVDQHLKLKAEKELIRSRVKRVAEIGKEIKDKGEYPSGINNVQGTRYFESDVSSRIYGGGSWFVVEADNETMWYVQNNGGDGDNWSYNNVQTGGAGAIGWRLKDKKLANELITLSKELEIDQ